MIQLQAIAPEGHPQGELIDVDAGRVLVARAPERSRGPELRAHAEELAKFHGQIIVLPRGYRLEVVQPVEVVP